MGNSSAKFKPIGPPANRSAPSIHHSRSPARQLQLVAARACLPAADKQTPVIVVVIAVAVVIGGCGCGKGSMLIELGAAAAIA